MVYGKLKAIGPYVVENRRNVMGREHNDLSLPTDKLEDKGNSIKDSLLHFFPDSFILTSFPTPNEQFLE